MNIRNDSAGSVSQKHILSKKFKIYEIQEVHDMGQATYEIPQYERHDGIKITGGYWNYIIKDKNDCVLFSGWWNSNEEFDETMKHIDFIIKHHSCYTRNNEIENKYNKLYEAVKEYMAEDKSIDALCFKMKFGMITNEDYELLKKLMPENITKTENPFGVIEMIKYKALNHSLFGKQ